MNYVGTAALSEPETRALYDYTRAHDFALTLSYHTQGRVIYWKYQEYEPENSYTIAQKMAAVSGYSLEAGPANSYAGYRDWFIQTYNKPGYTIEAGLGTNPLPISQFNTIYRDNIGSQCTGCIDHLLRRCVARFRKGSCPIPRQTALYPNRMKGKFHLPTGEAQ